jgi:hypothetical protein
MKTGRRVIFFLAILITAFGIWFASTTPSQPKAVPTLAQTTASTISVENIAGPPIQSNFSAATATDIIVDQSEAIPQPLAEAPKPRKVVKAQPPAQVPNGGGKKTIQDPMARDALALVGMDPEAELYWYSAIQDPTLSKSERQDLVDDLNEQGLEDPKHPTLDDLPLILNRLEILEAVVPSLPEGIEWQEPYDDLVNLVEVAMGGGKEVQ